MTSGPSDLLWTENPKGQHDRIVDLDRVTAQPSDAPSWITIAMPEFVSAEQHRLTRRYQHRHAVLVASRAFPGHQVMAGPRAAVPWEWCASAWSNIATEIDTSLPPDCSWNSPLERGSQS
jgi:hypothetical protein